MRTPDLRVQQQPYGGDHRQHTMQEFAQRFKAERESIVCRELLKNVKVTSGALAQERNDAYYRERPCLGVVEFAASILQDMLDN